MSETTPIEQFTEREFETALTEILNGTAWKSLGFVSGELAYAVPIKNTNKRLVVRSSIDYTGVAAATGEDSIRVWVEYWHEKARTWRPLGKDGKAWTTRLPGWQERLKGRLRQCWKVALADKPKVAEGAEICPKCGAGMILRTNRVTENQFWGCSNYPKCKGSKDVQPVKPKTKETVKDFTWADNQNDVFAFVETGEGHGVVEAVAGSGKTTTIIEALNHTDSTKAVGFVAFNKHIATELKRRAPSHVHVSTNHSLGFANIRAVQDKIKVDEDKLYRLLRDIEETLEPEEYYAVRGARPSLWKLVSLAKANMMAPCAKTFGYIADRWNIETNGDADLMYRVAGLLFEKSVADMAWLDYDDMIWFPAAGKVACKQFDILFIDEAQDLNKAQAALVMNSIKPDGRIIAVGDRHQSIYGFAGADADSIPNIIDLLEATVLPLSTTYRCPKSHVALVQQLVPQIEAAEWASEGVVKDVNEYEFVNHVAAGDLVLCRCNAPLVVPAFLLVRRGIKAVILGRDIGRGLKLLLSKVQKKHGVHNLFDTLAALVEYGDKEIGKLLKMKKQSRAQALEDRIETIVALADGSSSMGQLEDKIETIFSDEAEGVTFSSVHRAKGAEADRVWILRPDLMPHPRVSAAWEMQQEYNIQYVALTRAKKELCFVQG